MPELGACGPQDVGGQPEDEVLNTAQHAYAHWERRTHALIALMVRKRLYGMDEHRRATEQLPDYETMSYYEKVHCCS